MPALFVFLLKVNLALLVFCAGYYLVLRHLTFYTLNRIYLVTAIVFASLYPKIDLTAYVQRHQRIAVPVRTVILNWQAPAAKLVKPLVHPNYWHWATLIFWAGVVLLALRLAMQLVSLLKLYRSSRPDTVLDHDVRVINGDAAPFSFWRSIYVNPANHTTADLKAILLHEQVHVNGWHTLDILLAELSSIFYWFNPGVWLMKKAVRENIEFITDRKILNNGVDTKAYQYSLVNVSFSNATPGIVNHFNISTIKKRIIMMNAKRSSKMNLTRYALVLPAVMLLLLFSFSKAAIVKRSARAMRSFSYTVSTGFNRVMPQPDSYDATLKTGNGKPTIAATASTFPDRKALPAITDDKLVLNLANADTGKKHFFISTFGGPDSLIYVLNGKAVTAAEFKKMDPNNIMSINIVDNADAARLLDKDSKIDLKSGGRVLFITTKDSPDGKKLADLLGSRRQLTRIVVNKTGDVISEDLQPTIVDSVVTVKGYRSPVALKTYRRSKGDLAEVVVKGYKSKSDGTTDLSATTIYTDNLTVKGQPLKALTYTSADQLKGVQLYTQRPNDLVETKVVNGEMVFTQKKGNGDAVIARTPAGTRVYFGGSSVSRISDKLILIDGKEASEKDLKSLSAFDIDRMTVSSDADTTKKYGDRARYGVVYIYTKKRK